MFKNFTRQDGGVTSIEYALIAAVIAMAVVGGATIIGTKIDTTFGNIATTLS